LQRRRGAFKEWKRMKDAGCEVQKAVSFRDMARNLAGSVAVAEQWHRARAAR
jgi:hypothetical protein